jgi:two-component system, cell cycle sensor histidine kinase PleC
MSLADVAGTAARAAARQTFAYLRPALRARVTRSLASLKQRDLEPLLRWSVPAALAIFVAILVSASVVFALAEEERIIAAATADVDMAATVIAAEVGARLQATPQSDPQATLSAAIPLHALSRGQRVFLSDATGAVIASFPETESKGSIGDHLGAAQPLTVFAEKAGVMRLTGPSGEILATVRGLPEPLGQITLIHPLDAVLCDWHAGVARTAILIAAISAVLAALALAYLVQATRAREADSSCRMMRDRVDMVLSRGRCGLFDWDLTSGAVDWSMSMFEILGMTPRAQTQEEVAALLHSADGGFAEMARVLSTGAQTTVDTTFRMRRRDDWVWLRAKAELIRGPNGGAHLVGIAIDVTETMALEERTATADMRLRDAIETISEAFVVWDAKNCLVMCNSKFQRFHNLPNEAVAVGTPYAQVMENGTAPLIQSQVVLGEALPFGARTFEAQLADGRWLQINERRTKDGGYVSVGTDITALKRHEEQLIQSETELRASVAALHRSHQTLEMQKQQLIELAEQHREQKAEAEKANRAKSDFLANMQHELFTPLNAILGFSECMMQELFGAHASPLYTEYSRDIHTSGKYLHSVIADVLEMSRLDAGRVILDKQEFVAETAITTAISAVVTTAEANRLTIESELSSETPLVADRIAVEKILTIVLANAVKYTPAEGRIVVRSRPVQGALNIYVEDTGVGIAPEAMTRLGRPFEQSDKTLKNGMRGSGLGLAIARSLVDLHGGRLTIRSQQGVGTVVHIHLPNRRTAPPKLHLAVGGRPSHRPHRAAAETARLPRTA